MPHVVIDEGDEISAPAKTNVLCWPPYIIMYQVELVPAPVTLVGEGKSMLLSDRIRFPSSFGHNRTEEVCTKSTQRTIVQMNRVETRDVNVENSNVGKTTAAHRLLNAL